MNIGYIGLGKMGHNMVERLIQKGYRVVAYDVNAEARAKARRIGAFTVESIQELTHELGGTRLIWVMVPHKVMDPVLRELFKYLRRGDTIIDGGNSFYEHTLKRARKAGVRGIRFLDAGVSGGPHGARNGACIMVGGDRHDFDRL